MKWQFSLICWLIYSTICFSPNIAFPREKEDAIALLRFAEYLYQQDNFDPAITEYQRFLFFHPHHPFTFYALYKTGMAYTRLGKWNRATTFLKKALRQESPHGLRQRIRYQLSLALIASGKWDLARIQLFKISKGDSEDILTRAAALVYGLLLTHQESWRDARTLFEQLREQEDNPPQLTQSYDRMIVLLDQVIKRPQKKSPTIAKWLSTFLPGSGQIYSGKVLTGVNALAVNAGTTYFLAKTIRARNMRDAVLVFSLLWTRYYIGNRLHAAETAIRSNRVYRQQIQQQIYSLIQEASQYMSSEPLIIEWSHLPSVE